MAGALNLDEITRTILASVDSIHTKREYQRALDDFRAWLSSRDECELSKAVINAYVSELKERGMTAGNINIRLIAIRRLAAEAADNGDLDSAKAAGILRVKGIRAEGRHLGNWLTKQQTNDLLKSPDISTLKGRRDKAILAVLFNCGLRREEAASLTFEHIQQREGRWVIVDLIGKGNKLRSIPISPWCKAAIDTWSQAAGINKGFIFRSLRRGGHLDGESMTPQAIYGVVLEYSSAIGLDLSPHDCRRTFAKLAHRGGSSIEQIQYSLGHSSIVTTQIYLGTCQDLIDAPCDHLGIGG